MTFGARLETSCNGKPPMLDFETRVALTEARLLRWCEAHGIIVSAAGEVCERDACSLLGFASRDALRHQSAEGRLSPTLRRRRCGPKWLYEIASIARELEEQFDRYSAS
jgi:hypothetical protein